ncbi:DUF6064 family protein [Rhodoferax ferrireducens]|uniref:DUF6064 family protein n=1 Tax=Rhodoferax ferrireducens TaxID=192843 RepID=UPI000E0CD3C8|nr:DUF6064 family protein [Rhodoferax ferrireducens]
MQLPFSVEQFFGVFRDYNTSLWPAQVFLVGLALMTLAFVFYPRRWSGAVISAILAFLWAWLGLAYHLAFFTAINPLAYGFSAVSLAGAALFFWQGVVCRRLEFRGARSARTVAGLVLIAFALLVYPAWSMAVGHSYPAIPTFGVPCPTTIFTIGLLCLAVAPYPRSPLVVPVVWCFIGAQAVFLLDVPPDTGVIAAGVAGVVLLARAKVAIKPGATISG